MVDIAAHVPVLATARACPRVCVYWICAYTCVRLDTHWTHVGSALDAHWKIVGQTLDSLVQLENGITSSHTCAYIGHTLDTQWITVGQWLDTCWKSIGLSLEILVHAQIVYTLC